MALRRRISVAVGAPSGIRHGLRTDLGFVGGLGGHALDVNSLGRSTVHRAITSWLGGRPLPADTRQ